MCGASRSAGSLVAIFAMAWIRLISLKSRMSSAPSFFCIRMMFTLFGRLRFAQRRLWIELSAARMSGLMIAQHFLKKSHVNPSGPGALSCGERLIARGTSSSVNGVSSAERSTVGKFSSGQFRSLVLSGGGAMMLSKCCWTMCSFSSCEQAHPSPFCRRWMNFFVSCHWP